MAFLDTMIERACADKQTIVLAEGNDVRTLEAAQEILEKGIANVIILGNPAEILATEWKLDGATIIDPETSELHQEFVDLLVELRAHKGMTPEKADVLVKDVLYFGTMLVKTGRADGMVTGACHSTGDVLRPCLQIIKTEPGTKLVSTFFVVDVPNCDLGANGMFFFSDCALEVQPTSEKLAHIAVNTGKSFKSFLGLEPCVAMLSHSTYGSAKNDDAQKVVDAVAIAKELAPEMALDGEMQLDAALIDTVAKLKAPESPVAGKANVLIFPDIDAGNIGYKLVQRLAKADAFGPITQGLAAPVNDLSRGCSAGDIVGVVAITCVQAQTRKAQQ